MEQSIEKNRGWEECCKMCWQSDRLDALGWAAIFVWGALVLLAEATNFEMNLIWWDGWAVFFTGAGVIVLLEAVLRLLTPGHRHAWVGNLLCGLILLGFGLGDQVNWGWGWPIVLITIGLIILQRTFPVGVEWHIPCYFMWKRRDGDLNLLLCHWIIGVS